MIQSIILAVIKLSQTLIDLMTAHKTQKAEEKYEDRIDEIKTDPVAHARNKFGRVRDTKTDVVHSDKPE